MGVISQTKKVLAQDGQRNEKKQPGGYMAIYHDIEEICYGPLCGMPAIARVFLCIRHKLLRDGLGQKSIGHSFIVERTGLTKRQVITCAQKLEKAGLVLIKCDFKETGQGRIQFFENKYELNPAIFGEEYNWYQKNPTLRVYSKAKPEGSYSKKGVSPCGVKSDTTPGVKSDTRVVSDLIPPNDLKLSELLEKSLRKNPSLITHINNPSSEELDFPVKKKRTQKEHEAILRKQLEALKDGSLG